jgi:hypothetical protein
MLTLNLILKEIKDVPVEKLEEVYEYVHSLAVKKKNDTSKKKNKKSLLDFSGILSDMSEEDYQDFVNHTKKVRKELFNRKFDI